MSEERFEFKAGDPVPRWLASVATTLDQPTFGADVIVTRNPHGITIEGKAPATANPGGPT